MHAPQSASVSVSTNNPTTEPAPAPAHRDSRTFLLNQAAKLGMTMGASSGDAIDRMNATATQLMDNARIGEASEINEGTRHQRVSITSPYTTTDGQPVTVSIRQQVSTAAETSERQRQALLDIETATFGRSAIRDLERVTAELDAVSHYDTQGQPVYRVQGEARRRLTARQMNLTKTVNIDAVTLTAAIAAQAEHAAAITSGEQRVVSEAERRAEEMIHEQRVARLARTMAIRNGYREG